MAKNAYIKLVPSSLKQTITTEEVKDLFLYYQENTLKTGEQIEWDYEDMAFPYEIKETEAGKGKWFYLASNHERYNIILFGVDKEIIQTENGEEKEQTYIQITLDDRSVYGDKNKALEFSKYLGKKLQGEVHLFNGRIMYFYPRK